MRRCQSAEAHSIDVFPREPFLRIAPDCMRDAYVRRVMRRCQEAPHSLDQPTVAQRSFRARTKVAFVADGGFPGIEVIRPGAFITRGEQRLLKREIVYPSDPVLNEKAGTDQRVGGVGSASTHVFRSCEPSSLVLDEERREAALGLQDFGQKLGVTGVFGAQHVGSVTFFLIVLAHGPERLSD